MKRYINCVLCNSNESRLIFEEGQIAIVECKSCGLAYNNPRICEEKELKKVYDEKYFGGKDFSFSDIIVESWAGNSNYISSFYEKKEEITQNFLKILNEIERYKKEKGRFLELGCAYGFFLDVVRNRGWEAHGVEISNDSANYARQELKLDVKIGTLEEANYPDEYFDVIFLSDVLEHLPNPIEILKEINRILKPDGILRMLVPNDLYCLSVWIKKIIRGTKYRKPSVLPPIHLYFFSKDTLQKALKKTGFDILKIKFTVYSCPDYKNYFGVKRLLLYPILHKLFHQVSILLNMSNTINVFAKKRI